MLIAEGEPVSEQFVGEQIRPCSGSVGSPGIIQAGPVIPGGFVWRDKEYHIAEVLKVWKEDGPCRSGGGGGGGGGEKYLRKHWFSLRTTDGAEMKVYFERQAKSKSQAKKRWWLYTISGTGDD